VPVERSPWEADLPLSQQYFRINCGCAEPMLIWAADIARRSLLNSLKDGWHGFLLMAAKILKKFQRFQELAAS
jgi:hypothetical protein